MGDESSENTVARRERAGVTHGWTVVPIMLKPDALDGPANTVAGPQAADFAIYLASALDGLRLPDYRPLVAASREGAERARERVLAEMATCRWYRMSWRDVDGCRQRLHALHRRWAPTGKVQVAEVVREATAAIGFHVAAATDRVVTLADYDVFYGDSPEPDMHTRMQQYLLGRPVRLILLCGQQENSALHVMKTYLRRVMRYPTSPHVGLENWCHVTNPDAPNFPQFVRLCAVQSS